MHARRALLVALALSASLGVVAGRLEAGDAKTVIVAMTTAKEFKVFQRMLVATDHVKTLEAPGPFTVFAPTDAAFAKIRKVDLADLEKDKVKLARFVMSHIHSGKKSSKDLEGKIIKTLRGLELRINKEDGVVKVNEAKMTKPDLAAQNGYVHGLDKVLVEIDIQAAPEVKEQPKEPETFHDLSATTLDGKAFAFSELKGKVALVVNVASECGFTPQYAGLQKLHSELSSKGFTVLGFPSNEFGGQEPGDSGAIKKFCESRYKVTFPLFEKLQTKAGEGQSPIYAFLSKGRETPSWNFCKYLVGKDGKVIAFYKSETKPDDAELRKAIEAALK